MNFGGLDIIQVEPGTKIKGPGDQEMEVTDTNAVAFGRKMYCTPSICKALHNWDGNKAEQKSGEK